MKLIHLLLLFPLAALSQNISVVSAEKLNVVYRGIDNPIKIAVPGAKSFTATAPGMRATDEPGKYLIAPGPGLEVKVDIEAQMEDGTVLNEKKIFRIKNFPPLLGSIGGDSCYECTFSLSKQELTGSTIEVKIPDFLFFDNGFSVLSFDLNISDKKIIHVEGNRMNSDAIKEINNLKVGSKIHIDRIRYGNDPTVEYKRVRPIYIDIIERKVSDE